MSLSVHLLPRLGPALVVGAGKVGRRKIHSLLAAGFRVTVLGPELDPDLQALEEVTWVREPFTPDRLSGHALVFACTNRRDVNKQVGDCARERGIPVLVVDAPEESTFFSPAVYRNGALTVSVSTGGADPALSQHIRDHIAAVLDGENWAATVEKAGRDRAQRLGTDHAP